ncbi:YggS family pyridoxal phosphate-dependent enzyme [Robertkochia aurantiaca]|uniref:YggS family pyridoxal phosphate-dependent enzyme n=1 Tax=Robertkochia aurantiaca TaxID=2873700 RepID=UPI001CC9831A|nr:YggS family pyridoxal phosphate-dependent enzyme [Robertkochia sp. 3YJGBD-33]
MSNIKENLETLLKEIPENVDLVAVSKTKPTEDIMEAYDYGHRIFGENKVQEMVSKWEELPKDIEWHMIGHVQRNKVKYMAPFVSLIHGVDSLKLLKEIEKQGRKQDRVIPCLLQMHIASEETKFGLDENELFSLLESEQLATFKHVFIRGLMGMATFTDDRQKIEKEFQYLKKLYDRLGNEYYQKGKVEMQVLSMGMSGDYQIAIECGSNMVRIGSSIFGERNYN